MIIAKNKFQVKKIDKKYKIYKSSYLDKK